MAEDVMIEFSVELGNALENIKQLEDQVKSMQSSVDNQVTPSVNTMGTRVTAAGNKIKGLGNTLKTKLGTEGALAFAAVGGAALSFSKQCVQSAINSQQEWGRFTALVKQSGATADEAHKLKDSVKNVATEMHRTTGDTREAALTFMQAGLASNQLKGALRATAGVAARAGITESEAATAVNAALLGKGKQLEKLTGLRLEDYKTADGQIDKERLLNDLYNQNKGAIDQYANSTEAKINDMQNAWGRFKTSIGTALLPVVSILADIAGKVADFFGSLPEPAQQFIAVLLLVGGAIGAIIGVLGMFAGALVSIGGFIAAVGEAGGIVAYLTQLFPALGGAITFLSANLLPIIAIVLAVVAAFYILYEVGKKMGWWNDLSGMIAKFGEVLGQVVGAIGEFVNWFVKLFTDFPAAQAQFNDFINYLGGALGDGLNAAWQYVTGAVGGLIDALTGMFWDAVDGAKNGIMESLGNIGQIITDALSNLGASVVPGGGLTEGILAIVAPLPTLLYGVFERLAPMVAPAIMGFINSVIQSFSSIGQGILGAFAQIPGLIVQALMGIITTISTWLGQARMVAGNLVGMLVNAVVMRFRAIVARVRAIFIQVVSAIRGRLLNAVTIAGTLAGRVRQMIVNRFNQIIARTRQIFQNIVNTIRSRLANAASTARDKAVEIYNNIRDKIAEIPGKVADEFGKIPGKISSALASAASAAASGAASIVSSFLGALHINSPGIIQRSTAAEFASLPVIIADEGVNAARATATAASSIVTAWSDNMEAMTLPLENNFDLWSMNTVMGAAGLNMGAVTSSMGAIRTAPPGGGGRTLDMSTTHNNNDNATNIYVDKIELDCNNLTQQQSRQILYDALDGLYTGGV